MKDNLVRGSGGTGVGVNNVDWKNSVGCNVDFVFDEIYGSFKIIKYINNSTVKVIYNNKEFVLRSYEILNCKFSKMLGLYNKNFRYKKDDIVGDYIILKAYRYNKNNKLIKYYKFKCGKCGNIDDTSEYELIKNKVVCSVCNGKRVISGINDLWTTNPEIARFLKNKDEGFKLKNTSKIIADFVCNDCGHNFKKSIIKVASRGVNCPICGIGVSFPEKILNSILIECNVDFTTQKSFPWSNNKKYDVYIPEIKTLIEIHGRQHYMGHLNWNRTINDEKTNDTYKKMLAINNGYEYIAIDAKQSEINYIKNNIMHTIGHIIDFNKIDWNKCNTRVFSGGKRSQIYKLFNDGHSIDEISKKLNCCFQNVEKYLREGNLMGRCKFRGYRNGIKVICLNTHTVFNSAKDASDYYNIGRQSYISQCCKGKGKTSGVHPETKDRLQWKYYKDYLLEINKGEKKMKIYLAGKMSELTFDEMNGWRKNIQEKIKDYNIKIINPVDYYNFEIDNNFYNDLEVKNFDLHLVRNCDIVLVNLNYHNSIGTAIEVHECYENYKIPVISFASEHNYDNVHPWVKTSVSKNLPTMDEAIEYIVQFYSDVHK